MMRVFVSVKIKSISEEITVIWNYKKWSNNFIHDGNLKQNLIDNFLVFYAVGPMGRPRLNNGRQFSVLALSNISSFVNSPPIGYHGVVVISTSTGDDAWR